MWIYLEWPNQKIYKIIEYYLQIKSLYQIRRKSLTKKVWYGLSQLFFDSKDFKIIWLILSWLYKGLVNIKEILQKRNNRHLMDYTKCRAICFSIMKSLTSISKSCGLNAFLDHWGFAILWKYFLSSTLWIESKKTKNLK